MSEYDDGFDAGILHQCLQEREEDARREHTQRVAALGAIRRAVEIARKADVNAAYWDAQSVPTKASLRRAAAFDVRIAIRAAIGSEKT